MRCSSLSGEQGDLLRSGPAVHLVDVAGGLPLYSDQKVAIIAGMLGLLLTIALHIPAVQHEIASLHAHDPVFDALDIFIDQDIS